MYETLEDFAQTNGLRHVSPVLKLLLGAGSILLCVSSPGPLAPALIAVCTSLVTIGLARIPVRFYAGLLSIPVSFATMSTLVVLFLTGGGELLARIPVPYVTLTVTTGGVNLAVLLLARVFGGMCSLFFIALTTPMTEIFAVAQRLRVPEVFIDLAMLVYRFVFVFIEEAGMIYRSQVMRLGYGTFRESVRSFGMLAGALFLRTWESGEQMMLAMDARCYDGKFGMLDDIPPASAPALGAVALYLAGFLAISCLTGSMALY